MEMISITTVQKCQQGDKEFSKAWFIKLITENMNQSQFDRFCREVMFLNEHYMFTNGLTVTDRPDKIIELEDVTWQLGDIDFDQPVNFRKVK